MLLAVNTKPGMIAHPIVICFCWKSREDYHLDYLRGTNSKPELKTAAVLNVKEINYFDLTCNQQKKIK